MNFVNSRDKNDRESQFQILNLPFTVYFILFSAFIFTLPVIFLFFFCSSMRGDEAKEACPQIQLVQVPVARGKADLNSYRNAGSEVCGNGISK